MEDRYRTWRTSRGSRLSPAAYTAGQPIHVTIGSARRRPHLADRRLADVAFAVVVDDLETLAVCLMPDHLHWLLRCAGTALGSVRRFKSLSTRIAWRQGYVGPIWQRSFHDRVLRSCEDVREVAAYLVANPVRAGLVRSVEEYAYQALCLERWVG